MHAAAETTATTVSRTRRRLSTHDVNDVTIVATSGTGSGSTGLDGDPMTHQTYCTTNNVPRWPDYATATSRVISIVGAANRRYKPTPTKHTTQQLG